MIIELRRGIMESAAEFRHAAELAVFVLPIPRNFAALTLNDNLGYRACS